MPLPCRSWVLLFTGLAACGDGQVQRFAQPGDSAAGDSADPTETADSVDTGVSTDTGDTVETADTTGGDTTGDSTVDSTGETAAGPTCGDATCNDGESCWDCASDCGACDCPQPVEVIIYTQSAWTILSDAFAADPSNCADYYISLPANTGDKTTPRADGEAAAMRAHGPRLHAMAEFQWAAWSAVGGSWYDKGVEFRRRMDAAGYDVAAGDTWAINELPSTVRSDAATRQDARDAMQGLYEGPKGSPAVRGTVFTSGMGQDTTNFSVYKPYVEDWLEDADFWVKADLYARWWAQEVYADPDYSCDGSTSVAERSAATNSFVEHVARLAEVGPSSVNTAQSYLGRAYVPLMNAVWGSADNGYGNTVISLDNMQHFVSTEVYAARSWSNSHNHPDGRVGFAWARMDGVADSDLGTLAGRLAAAIHYAYDEGGGSAAGACSPSGAYTWCVCDVAGASFNDGWDTFATW